MARKAGRKPKYRSEGHGMVVQDYGPAEIWTKSIAVRALGAETIRHHVSGYVLRSRTVSEGGVVLGAGTFNELQCPLDVLRVEGLLGDDEQTKRRFEAGEALDELHRNSGVEGKTTATWNSAGGGGIREQDDHQAEDEMRYIRAIKAIRPYDALVASVCVEHMVPPNRAKAIATLCEGLDLLARYFERPRTTSCRHEKRIA